MKWDLVYQDGLILVTDLPIECFSLKGDPRSTCIPEKKARDSLESKFFSGESFIPFEMIRRLSWES